MYNLNTIKIILANNNNSILHKKLNINMENMEKIIVSHSIVYVKSGTVKVETYDYNNFTVSNGEMLFMPRDSYIISDYIKEEKEMEVYIFFFDYSLTLEFLQNITVNNNHYNNDAKDKILKLRVSHNIINYITALKSINYENKTNIHLLKTKIFELLHLICEVNENFISALKKQEVIRTNIETYMLEHYNKNLSVSDWASLSGLSPSTFNRKFLRKYKLSPKKWITQQNMKLASEALKDGSSVSDCASQFGYSNTSNFIKAFKEIYKITPKQYSMI